MAIGAPQSLGTQSGTTSVSTKTLTTTNAIVAGDLVVVAIGYYNPGSSAVAINSVSDGTNSYTQALSVTPSGTTPATIALYYKENAAAVSSSASLTVTWASNTSTQGIIAARITGIVASSSLDATASSTTLTTTPSVTTAALSQGNEIVFGVCGGYNTTAITEDAAFTAIGALFPNSDATTIAYKIVSSNSAVTYAPTLTGASNFSPVGVATFKGLNVYPYFVHRRFVRR